MFWLISCLFAEIGCSEYTVSIWDDFNVLDINVIKNHYFRIVKYLSFVCFFFHQCSFIPKLSVTIHTKFEDNSGTTENVIIRCYNIIFIFVCINILHVLYLKRFCCLKFTVSRIGWREACGKNCGFRGRCVRRSQPKTLQRGRGIHTIIIFLQNEKL